MLATRFGYSRSSLIQTSPLTNEQIARVAPSVMAQAAHDSRSERYTYIPTSQVLDALRREGFEPFAAYQGRTRDESRREFTKHMLRLRHVGDIAKQAVVGDTVNEIILLNSHDGTSSYQMMAGCFRFVCANGMVSGEASHDIRVRHSGDIVGNVIEGAYSVLEHFDKVTESRERMRSVTLSDGEQLAFARAALRLKYEDSAPIEAEQLNRARRVDDRGGDLWRTFNRTQEALVRGGVRGRSANGNRTTTRAITGISENVAMNRALWTLAEEMAKLKA
jgi:hypothetical protein